MKSTDRPATRAEILQQRDTLFQWSNDLLQLAYRAEAFSIAVHEQCRARRLQAARLVTESHRRSSSANVSDVQDTGQTTEADSPFQSG
jgi:hypothetical protein